MNPALLRLTRTYINRRLFQSLLFVVGVALGVAVGVAIDLANSSSSRAFQLSVGSVSGRTTHQIVGTSGSIPTDLYRRLRLELGLRTSAPVIEADVQAAAFDQLPLRLLGVDPFAETPFRSYLASASGQGSEQAGIGALVAFLAQPETVLISEPLARRYGLRPGDSLTLQTPTRAEVAVRVVGLLYPSDDISRQALENLVLADIATAQEIAGEPGRLTRIDLILPPGTDLAPIQALLPPGAAITTPSATSAALSQMTDAFELNLQALSLLALIVGVFLIYNTVTFSVVQRRPVIGILRSLGTTRRQIFAFILAEALVLGVIGTALGLGLGVLLGRGVVGLVAQTVNDLYFRVNVKGVTVQAGTLLRGAVVGVAASLVAAVIPSIEATRTPPAGVMRRSEVERGTRRALPFLALGAALMGAAGLALLRLHTESVAISFVALFTILIGSALLTPLALLLLMRLAVPVAGRVFGVLGRMAPRAVVRSLSRTSVAVAALTLAVSVIVGVSVMISSFRSTVQDWLQVTLSADVFISSSEQGAQRDIDPALVDVLRQQPGAARVTTVRQVQVLAPDYANLPPVHIVAPSDDITEGRRRFVWNDAPGGDYWAALRSGAVIVSEPFAHHRGITRQHNWITLLTDQGAQTFPVVGVFYDYTTDQGTVMLAGSVYRQYYEDPYVTAIALDLQPGASLDQTIQELQSGVLAGTGLKAQSNRSLRASALEVFDRTFSITVALRLLATIVAFIGILSALLSLQLEHTRQYGIMRANGMTPRQLRGLTFLQTGLMGTTAGLLALPIGLILALILIEVINVRSFGWSMQLTLGPQEFVQAFAVALVASLVAGIYPAWRLSKLVAIKALRSE